MEKKNFAVDDQGMRNQGIGGSDAAAAIGLNPWKTPYQLWLEKTGRSAPPDLSKNPSIIRGNRMEPVIREWVKEDFGITIRQDHKTHYSKIYPYLFVHTDGRIQGKPRIAEIKSPSSHMTKFYGEEGTDELPDYYLAQAVHSMAIMPKIKGVDFFIKFEGIDGIKRYSIEREDSLIESYLAQATRFWDFVLTDTPPPPVNSADVDAVFHQSNGEMLENDQPLECTIGILYDLKKQIKKIKEEESELIFQIKKLIGDKDGYFMSNGKKCLYKRGVKPPKFNPSRLKEELPEIYNTFVKKREVMEFDSKEFESSHPDLFDDYIKEQLGTRLILPRTIN